MNSKQVRQTFLDFFQSKQHQIVASAPLVIKNDPTLMFTNAGMNQFKDLFLGNSPIKYSRIVDSQKCLRVSGKHNDLEEVGHDTYHHTMFEMLGNWSFGDYFKKDAIGWAWELLTKVYGVEQEDLYVTVFGGDQEDGLDKDMEAFDFWKAFVPENRILFGSKKDNFWEMGDTGPCGPCSEIHADIRSKEEKLAIPGRDLVNESHPQVIEIWNLVFIEFNRMSNGSLQQLPAKHVDTGMGFERLCMVLQKTQSNYDTDVFQPIISVIAKHAGLEYGLELKADIAMRVIADHLRAVAFAIADGQLPSNNKAGYVIRRILRRAVRYGFTFLGIREAFIFKLVDVLVNQMGDAFPELKSQQELVSRVIAEEEGNFLRTLATGIQKFHHYLLSAPKQGIIEGQFAFELFDTYGFPVDLTQLMAREEGWEVDMEGFLARLNEQKERSRAAAIKDTDDWVSVSSEADETLFTGYDLLEDQVEIIKYRKVTTPKKNFFQAVFNRTPFYAESGGQLGDCGVLISEEGEQIIVEDTQKENNLIVHVISKLPSDITGTFVARVDKIKRSATASNHSATHLLHAALRQVVGNHVEQKGSLLDQNRLRFDFSHFSKLTDEEIIQIEEIVNSRIRENISLTDMRTVNIEKAREMGAIALFGEKYGDEVRVIAFNPEFSIELCGGTHVQATGQIGLVKIVSESAIAAGVRRIEAISGIAALEFYNEQLRLVEEAKAMVKNPVDVIRGIQNLLDENKKLQSELDELKKEKIASLKSDLQKQIISMDGYNFLSAIIETDANSAKDLVFALRAENENLFALIGYVYQSKPGLALIISEDLATSKGWNAGQMIRELAKDIQGGGGGQPFFATAGGSKKEGLEAALEKVKTLFL
ncbi:MAG: alanine--tRNA ligase [Bacteroidales bacterium]|nr:alanine--tRNA ligase [Bacteroidales bacterium]